MIFNTPFLPRFSFTIIFSVISLFYCLLHYGDTVHLINGTYQRRWFKQFVVFYIYYFAVSVVSSMAYSFYESPFLTFVGSVVGVISLFVVALFLCLFVFRKGEEFDSLTDYIINAGVTESIFGIAAFFSPVVKSLLNGITIANSRSEKIVHAVGTATFRNYGIASTLFDSFGFGMSIMALLALYKALKGKPRYYVYCAMISFVASINARTSMVLIAVGSAIIVIGQSAKTVKAIAGKIVIIFFAFLALSLISSYVEQGSENAQWLSIGIDEIKALFTGGRLPAHLLLYFAIYIFRMILCKLFLELV